MRAHIQLGGPIVVIWDNLNTHLTAGLKWYEAAYDWLTATRLPAYAPDLNPVEAVWSLGRRAMANTAFDTPDDLDHTLRREFTPALPARGPDLPRTGRPGTGTTRTRVRENPA
ncbi:transposase [Streptomyces sp. NPDC007355]|uniref:transposase n=1 Tax=Streptomyces sp. NPDC007355 TaxID=3364778 RepID=UPI0036AF9341